MPTTIEPSLDQLVQAAITQSPYLTNRKLRFESDSGHITLRGQVGSYFQKQMAQEAIRGLEGVDVIENRLEVAGG